MIKNFKIYDALMKKKKQLKKLVLVGALSLGLTACSNEPTYIPSNNNYYSDYDNDYDNSYNDSYDSNYENNSYHESDNNVVENNSNGLDNTYSDIKQESNQVSSEITYDDALSQTIINSTVTLDLSDVSELSSTINSIDVDYMYSEYFGVDDAIKLYNSTQLNTPVQKLEIINGNSINADTLYNKIKNNNSSYKEQYEKLTKYGMPSDSELKTICGYICDSINNELSSGMIDIYSLEEKLQNLKVFGISDFTYGFYSSDEGIIAYNKKMIESLNRKTALEETICHEAKHLMQAASENQKEGTDIKNNYGICYEYNNLKVNSLHPNWVFEVAAESKTLNQLEINDSLNYNEYIKSLDMLKMSTIPTKENGTLENICVQQDLNKLYEYFGANTDEEKKEISTMLFAYNIILVDDSFSSTNEFYEYYKEKTGNEMKSMDKRYYGYSLSSSISQTLSKKFYSNLINSMVDKNVSVDDVFELITNFEVSLSNQNRYYDSGRAEYLQDFYNNYNLIQQNFFELIASKLGLSKEDVQGAYQMYYSNYKASENNIDNISDNNNSFIDKKYQDYEYYKQGTVYDYSLDYVKSYNK